MSMPVRGPVHVVMDHGFKDPSTMTLRDMVEWYKKIVSIADTLGTPTAMELKEIAQGWDYVVRVVATKHGVPSGWLMVSLQQLVQSEMTVEALDDNREA